MKRDLFNEAFAGLVLWACINVHPCLAEEPDDSRIVEQILKTREAILKQATNAEPVFAAFWDFDGTILKGDCSEGLVIGGKRVYPGLAQVCIENGLSQIYAGAGGFERFWTDYTNMDLRIGHWLAYPFIPQMLRGAKPEDVLQVSRQHFANVLSNYLMASSVRIIRDLQAHGVECHIISASADLFVKGAARGVGIPEEHIHGIEVRTRDGRLTEEVLYPITWNIGKLERLREFTAQREKESGRKCFVVAGFGDSYSTDGPFLKFIASQALPAGNAIAVFYDVSGDEPAAYKGLFYHARHNATVSGKAER